MFLISPSIISPDLLLFLNSSEEFIDLFKGKSVGRVVIGSGFGGIAAALRLKAKGHNVTLIEKHPDLGGRARVFKKNGFTYDGGPTVITAPYLFDELL